VVALRIIFLVLLLANAILFVWGQGRAVVVAEAGREPQRLAQELASEKLRILPPQQDGMPQ